MTTRRAPQPPIDPAFVVPASEWQKNRARDVGKPPTIVVVDDVVTIAEVPIVHYHYKETGRRGSMPLADFCAGSEHRVPDSDMQQVAPEPVAAEMLTVEDRLARIEAQQAEMLEILRRKPTGQLSLGVA